MGGSLWPLSALDNPSFVRETNAASARYRLSFTDTFADRLDLMDIHGEIAFEVSKGVAKAQVKGSGSYLSMTKNSDLDVQDSVQE